MMTRRFNPFTNLPPLTPSTPTKPATDPRAGAVAMILAGGRYWRGQSPDDSNDKPADDKGDTQPGKPDEPAPGQLILDAVRRRQEGK
jgi:hypothetical protein